ncbi:MAG: hypothetical protein O2948_08265 [Proteobacteria bacterium]|nr:hypothetical protein [Pseudomonadota bacterium]MDA0928362.1 hypothetical protein [Pseudomonadota bacterium]
MRHTSFSVYCAVLLLGNITATALGNDWQISEVFSNFDGRVQYIQLSKRTGDLLQSQEFVLQSNDQTSINSFAFSSTVAADRGSTTLLLATKDFSINTGVIADATIPDSFVPMHGGSLRFINGSDTFDIDQGMLPLNGSQALHRYSGVVLATALTASGETVTLHQPSWAQFDEYSNTIILPQLELPDGTLANLRLSVDLVTEQFTVLGDVFYYLQGISSGDSPAVFNVSTLTIPALLIGEQLYELRLKLIDNNSYILGNPEILGIASAQQARETAQAYQEALNASIARGAVSYSGLCAHCHGDRGEGYSASAIAFSNYRRSFAALRNVIASIMPFDNPGLCLDSGETKCATDVANYVLYVLQQPD